MNRLSTELEEMKREREREINDQYRGRAMTRGNYTPRYKAPNRHKGQTLDRFQTPQTPDNTRSQDRKSTSEVVCWRCGQKGHLQIGCRVRVDHFKGHLNEYRPSTRGKR